MLAGFVEAGKVRALGVSNFNVAQMEEFRRVAPLASDQPPYNIFERESTPGPAVVRGKWGCSAHIQFALPQHARRSRASRHEI